jgi:hypothetical protein
VIKISFPNGNRVELGSVVHHKNTAWAVEDIDGKKLRVVSMDERKLRTNFDAEEIGLEVKHYMDAEERDRLIRAKMTLREYWEDM